MRDKLRGAVITVAAIAALALGATAIAGATGGDDETTQKPITGRALDRAKAVALDHTGGGKVTGTEVADEEGAYEIEVTRAGGGQVDVHLDKAFKVIDQSADGNRDGGENDSGDED
jgi:hypothetical protein